MNEFLQQFLIESRDQIEQATDGLLILEQTPNNAERLDAVFRAVHTLKGGAGIVEFGAMERALHAAEDILSEARSGKRTLTTQLVGDSLACLDQVVQWLDMLEQTGEFPSTAEQQADAVIQRFRAAVEQKVEAEDWLTDFLHRHPSERARAKTAIRFTPDADCFFRGEDPLERVGSLTQLLALECEPLNAWPPLDNFDSYQCNLVITALTASSTEEVAAHMHGHSGSCEIRAVSAEETAVPVGALPMRAREILEAQIGVIRGSQPHNFSGRVTSAGRTAANVLLFLKLNEQAESVSRATEKSLQEKAAEPLRNAIEQALALEIQAAVIAEEAAQGPDVATRTLRVDAERIDTLVRLTGELTVAKNAFGHVVKLAQAEGNAITNILKDRHSVLERLIGELQRSVLGMRVLPLRSVLQRFPRVLREMSASLGKPATLEIEGDDTDADKAIVEMLFEPLLHIVRNAVDHGVESPKERLARGKPPVAKIRIRATRQADQVLIEVSDDGGGINVDRVREVAKTRGVATEEDLRAMTEADVVDLVFAPGFSTAAKVTELSGRGVGMDAVRTAVERVGGRVSIESRAALGTTVRIALPFSVMMTHVMTVEAGNQMFGIPLDAVVETVRVPQDSIARVGAARAIVLRNRTIPIFQLASVLGVGEQAADNADAVIVITSFAGQFGGIQVDRVGERLEVILKPLEGLLAGTPGITGTTLLGDGRVLLVLDIGQLLQ